MSLDLLKGMGVKIPYKAKYDNFIGGKWVAPVGGEYFDVISPVTGLPYTKGLIKPLTLDTFYEAQ